MFGKRASFRWYARQDLNLRPSESESDALSAAPRARMFDLRRLARVCFLLFSGQTVVKGVSLFCFRCPMCQCLQPLADFRYSTRRVCRSYAAVHESSVFWQVFMYGAQNVAVCKTALNRCGAMVQSCFLCRRENSSQIVV